MTAKDFTSRIDELTDDELRDLRDLYLRKMEDTDSPRARYLYWAAEGELLRRAEKHDVSNASLNYTYPKQENGLK